MSADEQDLVAADVAVHERIVQLLEDPERDGPAAVAWCSAHLGAVDDVLYRPARRAVGSEQVHVARSADRVLQHAVGRLDRRLTGDTHLDHVPLERVVDEVRVALAVHTHVEGRLVEQLSAALSPEQRGDLVRRLETATGGAPTRPHPHVPHTPFSRLLGRVEAAVDRVRDAMDNRVGATGHPTRAPRPLGRWGSYLMGVPDPQARRRER